MREFKTAYVSLVYVQIHELIHKLNVARIAFVECGLVKKFQNDILLIGHKYEGKVLCLSAFASKTAAFNIRC